MFRQGMHDLKVWPGVEGDGGETTSTPGRTSSSLTEDQMGRLAKVRCEGGVGLGGRCNPPRVCLNHGLFQGPDLDVLSNVSTSGGGRFGDV